MARTPLKKPKMFTSKSFTPKALGVGADIPSQGDMTSKFPVAKMAMANSKNTLAKPMPKSPLKGMKTTMKSGRGR